jgi:hypothetical protein
MARTGLVALAAALVLGAWLGSAGKPDVPFAPYDRDYRTKTDFARLEHRLPLTRADLAKLTPQGVARLTQEELDQLYARLTAGPIPNGTYRGAFFFAEGAGLPRLAQVLGGIHGRAADVEIEILKRLVEKLWQGKVFYRDQRVVRNVTYDRASVDWLMAELGVGGRSLRPTKTPEGKDAWLLFPAKLYCGQSLLDGRRESIILDYAFTDELAGYQAGIDSLGGRSGAQIRDEIRRVRPGLYLGRAYLARVFALNFTLENEEVEREQEEAFLRTGRIQEECWPGHQRQLAVN